MTDTAKPSLGERVLSAKEYIEGVKDELYGDGYRITALMLSVFSDLFDDLLTANADLERRVGEMRRHLEVDTYDRWIPCEITMPRCQGVYVVTTEDENGVRHIEVINCFVHGEHEPHPGFAFFPRKGVKAWLNVEPYELDKENLNEPTNR